MSIPASRDCPEGIASAGSDTATFPSRSSLPSPARGPVLPRLDVEKLKRHLPECRRVRIEINGVLAGTPVVVPDAVSEFAIGWAFVHRFFLTADQLTKVSSTASHVSLMIDGGVDLDRARYEAIGWISRQDLEIEAVGHRSSRPPRAVMVMTEMDAIASCRRSFERFDDDGARAGYRHVALVTADDILCIARDVVSDAAAAKVLGWALPNNIDCTASMLVVRGILDAPMVESAARARIPVVATDAVPTAAAIASAEASCTSIVGLALSHRRGLFADGGHLGDDASAVAATEALDSIEPRA
ncbi:MAG: formate dehydrogenase accessory sulfurtransferase FdhD [Chloroflexota bacterium]|nr:formate dehydrogenase accessory sulfurtransferase FdhD [Chloroflexota bacterium]